MNLNQLFVLKEAQTRNPDLMSPSDYDRYQQDQMDYGKRDFKRREHEAEWEQEKAYSAKLAAQAAGPWYIRLNGKLIRDKAGNPYKFQNKAAANKAAVTMQAKLFNKGKEFMLTTNPNDKPQGMAEAGSPAQQAAIAIAKKNKLKEFAPDDGSGGEEDTLRKYARMWYNGDLGTQQQVEKILDRMGWEIGEIESEEGGAFVVRSGDEHGNSYIGFALADLTEGVAEGSDNITAVFSGYGNYMKGRGANVFKHYGITVLDKQYDEDEDIAEYTVSGSKEALDKARAYLERSEQFGGMILKQGVAEDSQRVDSLVTDALKLMRGPEASDAVAALKTVLGDREYNSRRGHYNFYVRQMLDMYNKQGVAEGSSASADLTESKISYKPKHRKF